MHQVISARALKKVERLLLPFLLRVSSGNLFVLRRWCLGLMQETLESKTTTTQRKQVAVTCS